MNPENETSDSARNDEATAFAAAAVALTQAILCAFCPDCDTCALSVMSDGDDRCPERLN